VKRYKIKLSYLITATAILSTVPIISLLLWHSSNTLALLASACSITAIFSSHILLTHRFNKLVLSSKQIVNNPYKQLIYTGHVDDVSQLELALTMLQSQPDSVLQRILNSSNYVFNTSASSAEVMTATCEKISKQQHDLEQIAAAVEEMTTTTGIMTENTRSTLNEVEQAQTHARNGTEVVEQSLVEIRNLDEAIDQIGNHLQRLIERSGEIDKVAVVIQDIAEKTNLLALNTAIEAARAGENGRGFAVVADEVRELARRTRTSTEEIGAIIQGVQNETSSITASMKQGRTVAEKTIHSIEEAGQRLLSIIQAVDSISAGTHQIAVATEQQNAATQEINERVHAISDAVTEVSQQAHDTLGKSQQAVSLAERQIRIVQLLTKTG